MSNVGKQFHYKNDDINSKVVYTVLWEDAKGVLLECLSYNVAVRSHYTTDQFNTFWVAIPVNEYTILYRGMYGSGWSVWGTLGDVSEFKAAEMLNNSRKKNPTYVFKLVKTV